MKDSPLVTKLLCVVLVVSLIPQVGRVALPLLGGLLDQLEFGAVEAVASATRSLGLYAQPFG